MNENTSPDVKNNMGLAKTIKAQLLRSLEMSAKQNGKTLRWWRENEPGFMAAVDEFPNVDVKMLLKMPREHRLVILEALEWAGALVPEIETRTSRRRGHGR